jgi:ubiquinone/menaquinone biosynthesis C-methylase UbiE
MSTASYHEKQLHTALDPSAPKRLMPPLAPHFTHILDIGCGMGQTLIAAGLPPHIKAWGVDCDAQVIEAGKKIVPDNVTLLVAPGEKLPFEDGCMDFVFSRVSLPLMRIDPALKEMHRVLRPGGEVWLVLHTCSMYTRRIWHSLRRGHVKDAVFCCFVILNGMVFSLLGKQLSWLGQPEAYQTRRSMRKAFQRAGLVCTHTPYRPQRTLLIMQAMKPPVRK